MRQLSILWPKISGQSFENPTQKRKPHTFMRVRQEVKNLFFLTVGTVMAALGYSLFQVPYNLAAGGIGGVSIIINHFTGWPIGVMILVMNIPLLILGFFYLGRWPFVLRTVLAVLVFSIATDLFLIYLTDFLPEYPLTDDILLSAVYGGLVGGIGGGLVYRSGSTIGGTGIVGRIMQTKTGIPLSQIYLYTDGVIVLAAGAVFGWEVALYALLTLFLGGYCFRLHFGRAKQCPHRDDYNESCRGAIAGFDRGFRPGH